MSERIPQIYALCARGGGESLVHAKAALDAANSLFDATPFSAVSLALRELHEHCSIAYASALLRRAAAAEAEAEAEAPRRGAAADTPSAARRAALKILDLTLLKSGVPRHAARVHRLVADIEPLLAGAVPPMPSAASCAVRPPRAPAAITAPVRECRVDDLYHRRFDAATPCVVRRMAADWPAVSASDGSRPWTVANLRRRIACRWVPVELGSSYTDQDWGQAVMLGHEFVDRYVLQSNPRALRTAASEPDATLDNSNETADDDDADTRRSASPPRSTKRHKTSHEDAIGYLAQHNIFSQIPSLFNDILVPDFCYTCESASPELPDAPHASVWFGPADTVTPLHTDPYMNIFTQVTGRKYVRLYSPSEGHRLYPHDGVMANTSRVDVLDPDHTMFPRFADAEYVEAILGPGDCLFIPVCGNLLLLIF
ncbi:Lysine-specific demethylase 8 [Entophlyctis sp. JEL0112]|nr:Lysine-specific demethylase 8 [Entophlyctis sp. JEL0112]